MKIIRNLTVLLLLSFGLMLFTACTEEDHIHAQNIELAKQECQAKGGMMLYVGGSDGCYKLGDAIPLVGPRIPQPKQK